MLALDTLEIVLTSACNLRCSYCYENAKRNRRMEWGTLRAALDLLARSPARELSVVFLGGEPLLERQLLGQAIEHLRRGRRGGRRVEVSLSTNGLLLDLEAVRFLARHRIRTQLSFDGVRGAQDLRAAGTFDLLDALLGRLRSDFPGFFRRRLSIALTLTPANLPHLADSVRYFLAKGVADLAIAPAITHEPGWSPELEATMARQLARVRWRCLVHYRRTGEVPLRLFRRQVDESVMGAGDATVCRAATGRALAVDVDGQGYACAVFASSFQRFTSPLLGGCSVALCLGDVRAADLPERLARLPEVARRLGIFHGTADRHSSDARCGECRFRVLCWTCPAAIGHIPGNRDVHRLPDFACAFQRTALACRERFPAQPTPLEALIGEARALGPRGGTRKRLGVRPRAVSAAAPTASARAPR